MVLVSAIQHNSEKIPEKVNVSSNPLQTLTDLVSSDMQNVNAIIIDNMQSDVDLIPKLAGYLIASGGKRIRPLLTIASGKLCGYDGKRTHGLAAAVEFIHTATLLHDDVVDESDKRRGQDSANIIFGNQASVLVGDFLFSRAFQLMVDDGSLDVLRILSNASAVIAEGEVLQLATTTNIDTTLEDYLKVIESKTAALFAAACEIGPIIAGLGKGEQEALRLYGENLGVAFQIVDDVLDYSSNQSKLGKSIGDDFKEGKMTLPVILAMKETDNDFWKRVIADLDQNDDDFDKAIGFIKQTNSLSHSMDYARSYAEKAKQALAAFPESEVKSIFVELADFVVNREY